MKIETWQRILIRDAIDFIETGKLHNYSGDYALLSFLADLDAVLRFEEPHYHRLSEKNECLHDKESCNQ